ncbi:MULTISPECIES: hypothetical protein [Corynebacterium]|uniref:Uncharacterized protein n=1 Tax=Corynebacterium provencense TaxID=1737425 RepID=A0A2Z3Z0N0_9CORY|nr:MULTISPECIES: hypothetical protein [Corynebacterium]AWT27153.1 hypothetical protein Csp1_24030 [Corynebacterium provencense]MCI1255322.1 hypothetical protein [Corynebacterium provencense]
MSSSRPKSLLRRLSAGAVTVVLASGLCVGTASADTGSVNYKASLGSIFSCKKHNHFYC